MAIISQADKAVQEDGGAVTAEQTMAILQKASHRFKAVSTAPSSPPSRRLVRSDSFDSSASDISTTDAGEFTFTYEEEADPEIFFVPYVWEVVTCVVTASTLEWNKDKIKVFALSREERKGDVADGGNAAVEESKGFAKDILDAV